MKCIARLYGLGGGAPRSLLQHILAIKDYGYNKQICFTTEGKTKLLEEYQRVVDSFFLHKSPAELWEEKKYWQAFKEYKREYCLIRKERPDLVVALGEVNGALYSYICRKTGIPLIVYIAGGTLKNQGQVIEMWRECEVVCFSKENESEIIGHYPQDHVHVISNRISITEQFEDIKTHYQTEQPEIHVLITSRLADDKIQSICSFIRLLSRCASENIHIVVRIAGDGPMRDELLSFCNEMVSDELTIQYLGYIDEMTEQFRWAHITAGKGRSVIEPIMMNRIGCIIGDDGKIGFCNNKNYENIYHYNFSGRNLETIDSLNEIQGMVEKIHRGAVGEEDVFAPSEMVNNDYSAAYLPNKLKKVFEKLPAPEHKHSTAFLMMRFLGLIISKLRERRTYS